MQKIAHPLATIIVAGAILAVVLVLAVTVYRSNVLETDIASINCGLGGGQVVKYVAAEDLKQWFAEDTPREFISITNVDFGTSGRTDGFIVIYRRPDSARANPAEAR